MDTPAVIGIATTTAVANGIAPNTVSLGYINFPTQGAGPVMHQAIVFAAAQKGGLQLTPPSLTLLAVPTGDPPPVDPLDPGFLHVPMTMQWGNENIGNVYALYFAFMDFPGAYDMYLASGDGLPFGQVHVGVYGFDGFAAAGGGGFFGPPLGYGHANENDHYLNCPFVAVVGHSYAFQAYGSSTGADGPSDLSEPDGGAKLMIMQAQELDGYWRGNYHAYKYTDDYVGSHTDDQLSQENWISEIVYVTNQQATSGTAYPITKLTRRDDGTIGNRVQTGFNTSTSYQTTGVTAARHYT